VTGLRPTEEAGAREAPLRTPTLIIGAGPGGLAVAGRLRQAGLDFEIMERRDRVASAWHGHYERLRLHTVKELSHLPGVPFPAHYPRYVARRALVEYYDDYAGRMEITPRFGEEVVSVRRDGEGVEASWRTRTRSGVEVLSRNVVVATGINRVPVRPHFPGEPAFRGRVLHACEYRNPVPFAGQRVLVVGMGNTGAEIALDLCEKGVDVALSVRGPVNIVPREVLGRPTQRTALLLSRLPPWLGDRLGVILRRFTVGDLSRYGIETPALPPSAQLRVQGSTPVIDVGTLARIRSGEIRVLPEVDGLQEEGVVFRGGQRYPVDAVILATGYRPQLEDILEDADGLLGGAGLPLDCVGTGRFEGLFLVGFDPYRPGGILGCVFRESAVVAERIAEREGAGIGSRHQVE
jgi:cation diffusion facilitator CzcD-associated flavoprotein CzcO